MSAPDWAVRAYATRPTTGTTEIGGTPIAWRSWGDSGAAATVLVHGGGAHARWWDHLAPVLAEAGRHVTAVDLAGHGDSGHRPPYDPPRWADELMGLVDLHGLDQPSLVGHSMGGFVVLDAGARSGSDAVTSVVVVDSPLRPPTPGARGVMADHDRPPRRYPTREAALERYRLIPDQPTPTPWAVEYVAQVSAREHEDGWGWAFDPAFLAEFTPEDPRWDVAMRTIGVPVDVITAEHSFVNRPDLLDHARRTLPADTGWWEIADAWHHVLLDRPRELVDLLDRLLAARGR